MTAGLLGFGRLWTALPDDGLVPAGLAPGQAPVDPRRDGMVQPTAAGRQLSGALAGVAGGVAGGLLDAAKLPGDVLAGRVDPMSDQGIGRAFDMAGLAMTGGVGGAAREAGEAVLGSGPIRAFHGSPHSFDRFDIRRVGTGEGIAEQGHGLYFADDARSAQIARDTLSPVVMRDAAGLDVSPDAFAETLRTAATWGLDGAQAERAATIADRLATSLGRTEPGPLTDRLSGMRTWGRRAYGDDFPAYDRALEAAGQYTPTSAGRMYEVAIDAKPSDMLPWDRGADAYRALAERLGSPKAASDELLRQGVPGIRYADPHIPGTQNYVLFSDAPVSILRKYAVPGAVGAGGAAAALSPDQAQATPSQPAPSSAGDTRMSFGLGGLFGAVDDYGRPIAPQPGAGQMPAPSPYAFAGGMPGLGGQPTGGLPPGMGGLRAFGALPMPQPEPQAPGGSPLSFGPGSAVAGMPLPSQAAPGPAASPARIRPFGALPQPVVDASSLPPDGKYPGGPPLPPPRPTEFGGAGSWDAPAETVPQPAGAQGGAPGGDGPSLTDRLLSGVRDNSNLLLGAGIGLMTTRGFGPGLGAGLKYGTELDNAQAVQGLAKAKTLAELQKYGQQQGNQLQTAQMIAKRLGIPVPEAMPLAANQSVATDFMKRLLGPEVQYQQETDAQGNTWQVDPRTNERKLQIQGKDGSFTLGPNQTRYGEDGNVVARGGPGAPNVQSFTLPDGTKVDRQLNPATGQWEAPNFGANPPEAGAVTNPFGPGKFNEGQGKAAGFTDRMMGAEQVLRKFEDINSGLVGGIAGTVSGYTPNSLKSSERQQFEQAQRDLVNAQLRRESGAAISEKEFENARQQYMVQPGDSAEVIAQKRTNRQRAIEAMGREGGPSYQPRNVFGPDGEIIPYQPRGASQAPAPRSALEAEARRRGLLK